jgi:hypothetical protein
MKEGVVNTRHAWFVNPVVRRLCLGTLPTGKTKQNQEEGEEPGGRRLLEGNERHRDGGWFG